MAAKARRNGLLYEVDVEIRNGAKDGQDRLHASAKAILTDSLPEPPQFIENGHFKATGHSLSLDEIYEQVLFHGQDLRGIQEIISLSDSGISARIAVAPSPQEWMQEPLRSRWIADPLVLDSAFQMAIIWCHDQLGQVSLPSYAASYRQFCDRFPQDGVSAVLEIIKWTERRLVGNFTFLNREKKVVASLSGYEAVMDPSLINAFRAA